MQDIKIYRGAGTHTSPGSSLGLLRSDTGLARQPNMLNSCQKQKVRLHIQVYQI